MIQVGRKRKQDELNIRGFSVKFVKPDGTYKGVSLGKKSLAECFAEIGKEREWVGDCTLRFTKFLNRNPDGSDNELVIWDNGAFVFEPAVLIFLGEELVDVEERLAKVYNLASQMDDIIFKHNR